MVTEVRGKAVADKTLIFEMRESGAPMREIAEKTGISKERVRQILSRAMGSTKHKWLSTLQLCETTGLPRNRVLDLEEQGVISPVSNWSAGKRHYLLWPPESCRAIAQFYATHHLCRVCNKPLPKNRVLFCSYGCRQERHKYKYMTPEEKQRVLANIRRYREKKRLAAQVLIATAMPAGVTA